MAKTSVLSDLLTILLLGAFLLTSSFSLLLLFCAAIWQLVVPGVAVDIILGIIIYKRLWHRKSGV